MCKLSRCFVVVAFALSCVGSAAVETRFAVQFDLGAHGSTDGTGGMVKQQIEEMQDAVPPAVYADPGWIFVGWDKSYQGIRADTTLLAQYVQDTVAIPRFPTDGESIEGVDLFVDVTYGSDSNAGNTPWAPFKTIQKAIDSATGAETILVNDGVYAPIDHCDFKSLTIKSLHGYKKTIIDGGKIHWCAVFNRGPCSELIGFTLRHGQQDVGGGAYFGMFVDCVFFANSSLRRPGVFTGGGGAVFGGALKNCYVVANTSYETGGGVDESCYLNTRFVGNECFLQPEYNDACDSTECYSEEVGGIEWVYALSDDGGVRLGFCDDNFDSNGHPAILRSTTGNLLVPSSLGGRPVTSIGPGAFSCCGGLTSATIPPSVTCIGAKAFEVCGGLTSVTIPPSVTNIGESAFFYCGDLTSVAIPTGVTSIAESAFYGCRGLTSLSIPSNVTAIGEVAFAVCDNLTSVMIPSSVTNLGSGAFYMCNGLRSATISSGVTSIERHTFANCPNLESVTIHASVVSIGTEAFRSCNRLAVVYVDRDDAERMRNLYGWSGSVRFEERDFPSGEGEDASEVVEGVTWYYATFSNGGETCARIIPGDMKYAGDLTIPSTLGGYPVTEIRYAAFHDCSGLTSLVIPEGMTHIGARAFSGCSAMAEIQIPDTIERIDVGAFEGCDALELFYASRAEMIRIVKLLRASGANVELPPDGFWEETIDGIAWTYKLTDGIASIGGGKVNPPVLFPYYPAVDSSITGDLVIPSFVYNYCPVREISDAAFYECRKIESVVIPEGVTRIGADAFSHCYRLKSLFLPESLRDIDRFAVYSCRALTSIAIPAAVTNIGEKAFAYCDNLKEIEIPASVTRIGQRVFEGCARLERIVVAEDNPRYMSIDGILYDKQCGELIWCPGAKTSVTIPASVTNIPYYAFSENGYGRNAALTRIDVEEGNPVYASLDGVLYDKAFTKLISCPSQKTAVTIPTSVTAIGQSAFHGCEHLTDIELPSGVTEIGHQAFYECFKLQNIRIPEGVSNISWGVFDTCYALTELVLPSSVTNIDVNAFYGCSGLTDFIIPEGVRSIGSYAFQYCHALQELTLPSSLTSLEEEVFAFCDGLQSVTIKPGLTSLERGMFEQCPRLETVSIPSTVTNMAEYVFYGCDNFTTVLVEPGDGERVKELIRGSGFDVDQLTFREVVALPLICPGDGSTFDDDTCQVSITCDTPGATIYYSTNGVTPRQSSRNLYSGPFAVDGTVDIVAFAVKNEIVSDYAEAVITKETIPLTLATALDESKLGEIWTGGDAMWTPEKDVAAKVGKTLARSGAIGMEESTSLETTVYGTGTLTFWWRTSCEQDPRNRYGYDHLEFSTSDGVLYRLDGETEWEQRSVTFDTEGAHTIRWTYMTDDWEEPGFQDCGWVDGIVWTGASEDEQRPFVVDDPTAVVAGDETTGFIVQPSTNAFDIVVSIPASVAAASVVVEVPTTARSVMSNGAVVKIVKISEGRRYDITKYLRMPQVVGGVLDLTCVEVLQQYVDQIFDFSKGASFDITAANPITTAQTEPGLTYVLQEGRTLQTMADGDSKVGDGAAWQPRVSIKGGASGFYRIKVTK